MKRCDIIRMAREAEHYKGGQKEEEKIFRFSLRELEYFVKLAVVGEREACAATVEDYCIGFASDDAELNEIAAAIRARGRK